MSQSDLLVQVLKDLSSKRPRALFFKPRIHKPNNPGRQIVSQHVKNAIPFSQFLRLRRLCREDTDFNNKCDGMCQFKKKKRSYPDSAVTTDKHRAQEIDRETALQTYFTTTKHTKRGSN